MEYKVRQPPQTLVCCPPVVMSDSEGDKLEHEIVAVGCQLAFVNQKCRAKKELIHEYEASLVVEVMDCLGFPSSSGPLRWTTRFGMALWMQVVLQYSFGRRV